MTHWAGIDFIVSARLIKAENLEWSAVQIFSAL